MMWEEVPAPRFATKRNPLRKTYGPEIGKVAELLGLTRLEHQQYIWDVLGEVQSEEAGDPNPGWWAYRTATITMPRRSGKTTLLQPMTMHRAEITQNGRLVMTAQTRIAAVKRWGDLADVIMSSYVGSRVKRKSSVGGERLTWIRSGSTFEPQPPNATAGHGDEPDLALATEIWSWSALQGAEIEQAIFPTFLTNNGQFIRESTAGTNDSAYYNNVRAQGRAAVLADSQLGEAYFEWSVPETHKGKPVESLTDKTLIDLVISHHPRSDIDMRTFLEEELTRAQGPGGSGRADWLRAYGNHTQPMVNIDPIIPLESLLHAETDELIPEGVPVSIGVDVDPLGREASVSVAYRTDSGTCLSEVVRTGPGTLWLPGFVAGMIERGTAEFLPVQVNDTGVTRDVADALDAAGFQVARVGTKDFAAAWNRWQTQIMHKDEEGTPTPLVRHVESRPLLEAVEKGGWRVVAQTRVPAAVDDAPISSLVSLFLAVWGADHIPEKEEELGAFQIF